MHKIFIFISSIIILIILFFLHFTSRFIKTKIIDIKEDFPAKSPVIYFLWHRSGTACSSLLPKYSRNSDFYTMISQNKSTAIMKCLYKIMGIKIISGSKNKGYFASIKEMIKIFSNNKGRQVKIALTPDGPRGPEMMIPDETIFKLVKKYNIELRFFCNLSNSIWEFKTWDRTYIYKPFSKILHTNDLILSYLEVQNLTSDELRILAEKRMFEAFNILREKCNLPKCIQGAVKKKRYE